MNERKRASTGLTDLDALLGGESTLGPTGILSDFGLLRGALVLLSGETGVGTTTLLVHAAVHAARSGERVLFACGDESAMDIQKKAERTGAVHENVFVLANNAGTSLDHVEASVKSRNATVLLIDSLQTMRVPDLRAKAGTPHHVQAVVHHAKRMAVTYNLCVLCVTKDGSVAGTAQIPHIADTMVRMRRGITWPAFERLWLFDLDGKHRDGSV